MQMYGKFEGLFGLVSYNDPEKSIQKIEVVRCGWNTMCMSQVEEVINSIQMNLACNGKTHLCMSFSYYLRHVTKRNWEFYIFLSGVSVRFCIPMWSKCHPQIHLFQGMLRNVRQVPWSVGFWKSSSSDGRVANLIRWYLYQSVNAV